MKLIDDGGPAFPSGKSETPGYENSMPYYEGMTLRDWFAGMALGHIPALLEASDKNKSCENIAVHAYQIADAMLAARKGKEEA